MGLGMLLSGLSNAGNSVASSASDFQKFSDDLERDRARADLSVEQARRIAENSNALKVRMDTEHGKIYQDAVQGYLANNPNADSVKAQQAGMQALAAAGKFGEATQAAGLAGELDKHALTQQALDQGKIIQTGYGGTSSILARNPDGTMKLDENGNPTVIELVNNTDKRVQASMAGKGPKPVKQSEIENAQIRAHQLVTDNLGQLTQPFPTSVDDPTKQDDPALRKLANSLSDQIIAQNMRAGRTIDAGSMVQTMVPNLQDYDNKVREAARQAAMKAFPPSTGFMGMGGNPDKPGTTIDPAVKAQLMKQGVPEKAFANATALQRYVRDSAMNVRTFEDFLRASAGTEKPAAPGAAPKSTVPNPVAPTPGPAPAAAAPVADAELPHMRGDPEQDPAVQSLRRAIASINKSDPSKVNDLMALGDALNKRLAQFQ